MQNRHTHKEKIFWLQWVLSTTVGYTLSPPLAFYATVLVAPSSKDSFLTAIVAGGLISGAIVGFLQWVLLRKRVSAAGLWVIASIVGYAFADYFTHSRDFHGVNLILRACVFGACVGILQSVINRMPKSATWRWVVANSLGWGLGEALGQPAGIYIPKFWYFPIVGAVVGIVTGPAMMRWLKLHSEQEGMESPFI